MCVGVGGGEAEGGSCMMFMMLLHVYTCTCTSAAVFLEHFLRVSFPSLPPSLPLSLPPFLLYLISSQESNFSDHIPCIEQDGSSTDQLSQVATRC